LHSTLPYKLFLAGFLLIAIGSIVLAFAPLFGLSFQGGGFIWVFPFPPFVFGTKIGIEPIIFTTLLLILALILVVIVFVGYKRCIKSLRA
jgi:uncharacterized membrane protein